MACTELTRKRNTDSVPHRARNKGYPRYVHVQPNEQLLGNLQTITRTPRQLQKMAQSPVEIAQAVNKLLQFNNSDDQAALLEVIQDYFYEPNQEEDQQNDCCGDSTAQETQSLEGNATMIHYNLNNKTV